MDRLEHLELEVRGLKYAIVALQKELSELKRATTPATTATTTTPVVVVDEGPPEFGTFYYPGGGRLTVVDRSLPGRWRKARSVWL